MAWSGTPGVCDQVVSGSGGFVLREFCALGQSQTRRICALEGSLAQGALCHGSLRLPVAVW